MEHPLIATLRRLMKRSDDDDESGLTLIELVVAVGIFGIFLAMMLATVVGLARGATRAQVVAKSTAGVLVVFGQLDRQARYADSINYPAQSANGYRYIEFRTPGTSSASGITMCTQWRFLPDEGRIEARSWNDLPGSTKTAWATKLTGVLDTGEVNYPFDLIPAGVTAGSSMQQLVISINAGSLSPDAGAGITTAFVARNSSIQSPSNLDVNGNLKSDNPVCTFGGYQP